jgi:FtsP/CotA-like multicopper oxidase with cupredoxin domain
MPESPLDRVRLTRREFAKATLAGGFALVACGRSTHSTNPTNATSSIDKAIVATEAARPHTDRTITAALTPQPAAIDLGGTTARTLAYGSAIPGPLIRANVGDEVAVTVTRPT